MFAVLHDLIIESGDVGSLEIELVKKMWTKVPAALISAPPPGGSRGYQAQVTTKVLRAMFGDKYDLDLRKKIDEFKPKLRDVGALIN